MPMQFRNWYRSLPSNEIHSFRDKIIDVCGITRPVFYNWLSGITPVPKLAQDAIIEIAGEPISFEPEQEPAMESPHPKD